MGVVGENAERLSNAEQIFDAGREIRKVRARDKFEGCDSCAVIDPSREQDGVEETQNARDALDPSPQTWGGNEGLSPGPAETTGSE